MEEREPSVRGFFFQATERATDATRFICHTVNAHFLSVCLHKAFYPVLGLLRESGGMAG